MRLPGPLAVLARVLANPALRRVLLSYLAFHIAEFATWVAILLYAYEQTGPASVGVVALIQLVPAAIVATPAAALGDRYPRQRVLATGYIVQAIAMLATAAAMAAGVQVAIVYALAAVTATSLVVTRPTQSALLPALSRTPDELTAANGAAGVVEGAGILIGPLLAAVILTVSTVAAVFALSGAFLVGAALATARLHPSGGLATLDPRADAAARRGAERQVEGHEAREPDDDSFLAGIRTVGADRDARLVVGLLTARMLMVGCADVLFVLLALESLGTGEPGAGILNAALGAGTILGGAASFALVGRQGLALVTAAGALAWGVGLGLVGVTASAALAPVLIIAAGAGLAVVDVAGRTLLQRSVRDEVLARVFGLQEALAMGALAVGSILVSGVTQVLALTPAVMVIALLLPAMVLVAWPRLRSLDRRAVVPVQALALLRRTRLFGPLPGPQLEAVARRGSWSTHPADTVLIREGDPGDRYFILSTGHVRVDQGGRHVRELERRGEGFGEIALLRDVPRTATVTTTTEVVVLSIDRAAFLAAVTGHPDAYAAAEREVDANLR